MMFYEDELYVEMCRKAGEVQEQLDDNMVPITGHGTYGIGLDGCFYRAGPKGFIWLPRLDQLIGMIGSKDNGFSVVEKLVDYTYHETIGGRIKRAIDTVEQLFLMYLMETRFNKTWDPDKREWVER